jgi:hypothetical protein
MSMTEKNAATKVDVKPETTPALERREERRLRRWDPFEMFDELQDEMMRLWGQAWPLMPRPVSRPLRRMALAPTMWTPSVDVYDKGNRSESRANARNGRGSRGVPGSSCSLWCSSSTSCSTLCS